MRIKDWLIKKLGGYTHKDYWKTQDLLQSVWHREDLLRLEIKELKIERQNQYRLIFKLQEKAGDYDGIISKEMLRRIKSYI